MAEEQLLEQIANNLTEGKASEVKEQVQQAVDEGVDLQRILNDGLVKGMSVIGEKFKKNEVYVPEVLIAARAMSSGMDLLKPKLVESGVEPKATACVGTVKGDLHDIGKNLVCMMLEGAGYNVVDLGVNVEAQTFLSSAQENNAQLIGMSALLTTTMTSMKDTIDALQEGGMRDNVKVMVGGAPLNQSFADEIGADGYAPDAASAVDLANQLVGA